MSFTGGQVSSQDGIVQCVQVYRHRMVSLTVIPCLQLTKGRLHDIHGDDCVLVLLASILQFVSN